MSSASGVVGPFAASATILALMRSALAAVIWFSSAAGMRMSHSISSSSALVTSLAPGKPTDRAVLGLPGDDALDVEAVRVVDAAVESDTARIFEPCSAISCAAIEPALPKPWTTTVASSRWMSRCFAASSMQ